MTEEEEEEEEEDHQEDQNLAQIPQLHNNHVKSSWWDNFQQSLQEIEP